MSYYDQGFKDLKVIFKNHQLWITLDNPDMSNAISDEMIISLCDVLDYADGDNSVRVIVITGQGKNFCAGGDIKAMKSKSGMFAGEPFELRNRYSKGIQRIPRTIESLQKPVVAMVNGAAIGAGCDLAAMCDIRVCSDKARFGETFTKLGLVPGDGGPYFLARAIGYAKAMEMYLTGKLYNSSEALAMGLVSSIFEHESLEEQTAKIVDMISANAPAAVQFTKTAMKRAMKDDIDSHLNLMSAYQGIAQRTEDHFEAIEAFMNKRPSEFKGR